jgi:NitT/TauT family transport system substrate-binding protein
MARIAGAVRRRSAGAWPGFRRALALASFVLAWTSAGAAQTAVRFSLDWRVEGPAALFLHGLDRGYFKEEGLDVTMEPAAGSREPIQRVATGGFDLGFGDVNTLIRFRDENPAIDLKAVMMVYDQPAFAIVGRKSRGVTADPTSLAGKTIGAPAGDAAYAQWPIFRTVNRLADISVKLESVGFPVREPMLAAGELDAVFGLAHSAFVTLKARRVPAEDIVVMLMADYGVELYGNAILASPKFMAENPEALKGFLRALARSIREVAADPDAALDSVLKRAHGARREIESERLKMALDQSVVTAWARANGFGGIDRNRWARATDQIGLTFGFRNRTRAADGFIDAFLPPAAARRIGIAN